MSGTRLPCLFKENSGAFLSASKSWNILFKALMGYIDESPRSRMVIVVICFLFCNVLDHLTMTVQYVCENIRSRLVKCLVGSMEVC